MDYLHQNLDALDHPNLKAILSTATGCGAQLSEYTKYTGDDRGDIFCSNHADICTFLAEHLHQKRLQLPPLESRVAIHTPCSQIHVLKQNESPFKILSLIPEIELIELPNNARCCGAAGSYILAHPEMSDALLDDKLEAILDLNPSIIITSNIGCRLHLQAGLRRKNLDIEVMHPVSLLDRQLRSCLTSENENGKQPQTIAHPIP
jgi:glycolate oxidase iron-sulfur subunit